MMTHCSSSPHGSIGARTTTRKNSRLPDRPQTYSAIWRGTSTPRPPTQEPLNDFPLLPLFSLPSVALARNGSPPCPPDPGGCLEGNPDSHRRQRSGGFERRVDVDALLDQSSSALITALQKAGQVNTSGLPPMLALMVASVQDPSMAKQIKGLLVQETGTFTRSGIETRLFRRKTQSQRKPQRPARTAFRQRLHRA